MEQFIGGVLLAVSGAGLVLLGVRIGYREGQQAAFRAGKRRGVIETWKAAHAPGAFLEPLYEDDPFFYHEGPLFDWFQE